MLSAQRAARTATVALVIALADASAQSTGPADAPADQLIGLWASETRFGPALRGELTIRREDQEWRARLAGREAESAVTRNGLHIRFPDNLGQFRGSLNRNGRDLTGWWLQPSGETEDRRDPGGSGQEGYQAGGAFLRPRDLLKIGQTWLDDGVWNGRRIVDAAWVNTSTAPRVAITPATTGLSAEEFQNSYAAGFDAYTWHLNELRSDDRTYREYEASGNGGQLLIVVPDAQLAVVFTAGNYMQGGIWGRWRQEIVAEQIIPALRR